MAIVKKRRDEDQMHSQQKLATCRERFKESEKTLFEQIEKEYLPILNEKDELLGN